MPYPLKPPLLSTPDPSHRSPIEKKKAYPPKIPRLPPFFSPPLDARHIQTRAPKGAPPLLSPIVP